MVVDFYIGENEDVDFQRNWLVPPRVGETVSFDEGDRIFEIVAVHWEDLASYDVEPCVAVRIVEEKS